MSAGCSVWELIWNSLRHLKQCQGRCYTFWTKFQRVVFFYVSFESNIPFNVKRWIVLKLLKTLSPNFRLCSECCHCWLSGFSFVVHSGTLWFSQRSQSKLEKIETQWRSCTNIAAWEVVLTTYNRSYCNWLDTEWLCTPNTTFPSIY